MNYILLNIAAYIGGQIDAFLYARKGADSLPSNEHKWLVRSRILWGCFILSGVVYGHFLSGIPVKVAILLLEIVSFLFSFSFWHNGGYYLMRDKVDKTAHGWKHTSPTDSSKVNFNYVKRRNMFYASMGVLLTGYFALMFEVNHVRLAIFYAAALCGHISFSIYRKGWKGTVQSVTKFFK